MFTRKMRVLEHFLIKSTLGAKSKDNNWTGYANVQDCVPVYFRISYVATGGKAAQQCTGVGKSGLTAKVG